MKLHLIILAALIALAASETFEFCKFVPCKRDEKDEKAQYCLHDKTCYKMLPQCMIHYVECLANKTDRDPAELLTSLLVLDNCKDKEPKCANP